MTQHSEDIWQRRYRDLERQFEHLLLNLAETMSKKESVDNKAALSIQNNAAVRPQIIKIVKASTKDYAYVYCVANGANMEYKFEFFANKQLLQDSGFTRLNSASIEKENMGLVDTCRVTIKSDFQGRREELTGHAQVDWRKK